MKIADWGLGIVIFLTAEDAEFAENPAAEFAEGSCSEGLTTDETDITDGRDVRRAGVLN